MVHFHFDLESSDYFNLKVIDKVGRNSLKPKKNDIINSVRTNKVQWNF